MEYTNREIVTELVDEDVKAAVALLRKSLNKTRRLYPEAYYDFNENNGTLLIVSENKEVLYELAL